MSMFDSINKPQWQHHNPEVRKAAIEQLDDLAVLIDLVNADPDPEVRAQALSRITDDNTLDELADSLTQGLQQQARAQRLQQLLPDASQLPAISDDAILTRIASLTDEQLQQEVPSPCTCAHPHLHTAPPLHACMRIAVTPPLRGEPPQQLGTPVV